MLYFWINWPKDIRVDPSSRSCKLEIPLAAQIQKPLSVIPGRKSGLLHMGVKIEVNCDLSSNLLIVRHAIMVENVIGLLQMDFRDLRFLMNNRFCKGNLDMEFSISSQRDLVLLPVQSAIIFKLALSWYFRISGKSMPPSEEDRHNVANLRRGFLLAQINELNHLFRFLTALCGKITGTIWIGYNNLGRKFIFKRAARPNQDIGRELHRSKSSLIRSNRGRKFTLYIWLKSSVICMPKYTKPPGDHLNGKGHGIGGFCVKLPSGNLKMH